MRNTLFRGVALATLFAVAVPVTAADRRDRAREAVAAARAKVETSAQVNGAGEVPRLQAEARAALRAAEEAFDHKKEGDAIAAANRAQELAETAIGIGQRNQASVQAGAAADAAAAQSQAAAAADQAAAANARADAAEQAAATAQADAAAARAAPPLVVAPPAPETTTTVKTETSAAPVRTTTRRVATRRVVKKPVRRASTTVVRPAAVKTTTTVTTKNQ